jgi:hypothetical protein
MLFKKHTIENYRGYLMSLVVLLGLLAISIGSVVYKTKMPISLEGQTINYVIFLLIAGVIFTSNIFINLGDKKKTMPASSFEKFLVGWLYSYVIFIVLFTAIFYGLVAGISAMGSWPASMVHYINIFDSGQRIYWAFIGYTMLHAIMLYGAIYFKKMHFIKTACAFFVIGLVIWLLNDQVLQLMIHHDISGNPPFSGLSFSDGHDFNNVDLKESGRQWTIIVFMGIAVILWFASYFRLKEKQV